MTDMMRRVWTLESIMIVTVLVVSVLAGGVRSVPIGASDDPVTFYVGNGIYMPLVVCVLYIRWK